MVSLNVDPNRTNAHISPHIKENTPAYIKDVSRKKTNFIEPFVTFKAKKCCFQYLVVGDPQNRIKTQFGNPGIQNRTCLNRRTCNPKMVR